MVGQIYPTAEPPRNSLCKLCKDVFLCKFQEHITCTPTLVNVHSKTWRYHIIVMYTGTNSDCTEPYPHELRALMYSDYCQQARYWIDSRTWTPKKWTEIFSTLHVSAIFNQHSRIKVFLRCVVNDGIPIFYFMVVPFQQEFMSPGIGLPGVVHGSDHIDCCVSFDGHSISQPQYQK